MLTFDPIPHTYRWNGGVVPSVTQIMFGLVTFSGVAPEVLGAARERGSSVHAACHYHDENDLDEDLLEERQPDVWAYLQGWKKFKRDTDAVFGEIEKPVYSELRRYAGTPDRNDVEFTYGKEHITGAQIDIKTSVALHPCFGVQTMAYAQAAGRVAQRRFTCQLRADKTYRLREWTDPSDWAVFVSLLTLHNFKERHRL